MESESQDHAGGRRDAAELAEALRRAIGAFVRSIRGQAGTPTSSRGDTLALLAEEGAMTIAALADRRRVKHQSMRLVLGPLAEDGLVALSADAADRRSKSVAITAAGRDVLRRDRLARAAAIELRIRDGLTAAERDVLAAAVPILERLSYGSAPGPGAERRS